MSTRDRPTDDDSRLSLDLLNDDQALRIAQKLADKFGKAIVVSDATGRDITVAPEVQPTPGNDRTNWHVGRIVARKTSNDLGRVVESSGDMLKVIWDNGRTSYYRNGISGNVRLPPRQRGRRKLAAGRGQD
jgi:hypothetical protein